MRNVSIMPTACMLFKVALANHSTGGQRLLLLLLAEPRNSTINNHGLQQKA
jgi:hypothetical protein